MEYFIQLICARRRITKFSRLWEECTQEQTWLITREEKMGEDENEALTTYAKKGKTKK